MVVLENNFVNRILAKLTNCKDGHLRNAVGPFGLHQDTLLARQGCDRQYGLPLPLQDHNSLTICLLHHSYGQQSNR